MSKRLENVGVRGINPKEGDNDEEIQLGSKI